jgi:antitoxin component YwqK of YwqJK toxin-antitoxin module
LYGRVTAEGYFHEGRPEGHWTRWHDNGQKREEFFITNGECAQAQHWDKDGVPI